MAAQPSLLGPHLTEGRLNYERRLTFRKAMLRSGLSSVRLASSNSKADIKSDLRLNRVLKTKLVFFDRLPSPLFSPGLWLSNAGRVTTLRVEASRPCGEVQWRRAPALPYAGRAPRSAGDSSLCQCRLRHSSIPATRQQKILTSV